MKAPKKCSVASLQRNILSIKNRLEPLFLKDHGAPLQKSVAIAAIVVVVAAPLRMLTLKKKASSNRA